MKTFFSKSDSFCAETLAVQATQKKIKIIKEGKKVFIRFFDNAKLSEK